MDNPFRWISTPLRLPVMVGLIGLIWLLVWVEDGIRARSSHDGDPRGACRDSCGEPDWAFVERAHPDGTQESVCACGTAMAPLLDPKADPLDDPGAEE